MQRDGGPGGGGQGHGTGASFTGPAEALEIVGNHAYAYNRQAVNDDTATFFEFTTGNYYFVGTITGGRNMKSAAESAIEIYFNDSKIYEAKYDNGIGSTLVIPFSSPGHLIIPAYTAVRVDMEVNDASDTIALILAGRIYRG